MAQRKDSYRSIVERVLANVEGHLAGTSTGLVERLGSASADRARRLETSSGRMAEALGDDHPRVVRMRRRAELVTSVAHRADASRERVGAARELRPHEWLVHGQIARDDGTPLEGMVVRVFDKDHRDDHLLGDEVTDRAGEFRAVYHARDFLGDNEELPELHVMVSDSSGKVVLVSDEPVQPSGGREAFFQIVLTAERLQKGVPRARCEAETTSGAQCRNLAVPGGTRCATHQQTG